MRPDQPVNPADEPSPAPSPGRPEVPAADGTALMPGGPREPSSRVRIAPQVMRIGRSPDSDIIVSELGVSKHHAELRRSPAGRYSIIDLNSHNGTYVNGTRVSEQELNEGDIITIGHATCRLSGGKLIEYAGGRADPVTARPATPEEGKTALQRERDLTARLRGQLDEREHRIDLLEAELRTLAAENPAVLPVLDRLGIRPEPGA